MSQEVRCPEMPLLDATECRDEGLWAWSSSAHRSRLTPPVGSGAYVAKAAPVAWWRRENRARPDRDDVVLALTGAGTRAGRPVEEP